MLTAGESVLLLKPWPLLRTLQPRPKIRSQWTLGSVAREAESGELIMMGREGTTNATSAWADLSIGNDNPDLTTVLGGSAG